MTTDRYPAPAGDLVLHHYGMSPDAEKVRCILGFKRPRWKSVLIPIVMPTAPYPTTSSRTAPRCSSEIGGAAIGP